MLELWVNGRPLSPEVAGNYIPERGKRMSTTATAGTIPVTNEQGYSLFLRAQERARQAQKYVARLPRVATRNASRFSSWLMNSPAGGVLRFIGNAAKAAGVIPLAIAAVTSRVGQRVIGFAVKAVMTPLRWLYSGICKIPSMFLRLFGKRGASAADRFDAAVARFNARVADRTRKIVASVKNFLNPDNFVVKAVHYLARTAALLGAVALLPFTGVLAAGASVLAVAAGMRVDRLIDWKGLVLKGADNTNGKLHEFLASDNGVESVKKAVEASLEARWPNGGGDNPPTDEEVYEHVNMLLEELDVPSDVIDTMMGDTPVQFPTVTVVSDGDVATEATVAQAAADASGKDVTVQHTDGTSSVFAPDPALDNRMTKRANARNGARRK